jgi:hypothetical protein
MKAKKRKKLLQKALNHTNKAIKRLHQLEEDNTAVFLLDARTYIIRRARFEGFELDVHRQA